MALASAQSFLPRSSLNASTQLLFSIPVCRQREQGEQYTAENGGRLERLEQRLQEHSRIHHHQRRRKTHLHLAVGLRKVGLLDGKKVIWSCFRGDVAQIQVLMSFSGDRNNPINPAFFLSVLYFKADGKPPPDEGLSRLVREGLKQRAELVSVCCCFCRCILSVLCQFYFRPRALVGKKSSLQRGLFCCHYFLGQCCGVLLLACPSLQGDLKVQTPEASTASSSSYGSSSYSTSNSSSSNSFSDEDGSDDIDYDDYSEFSSDLSATYGGPLSRGPSSAEQQPDAATAPVLAPAAGTTGNIRVKDTEKRPSRPGPADEGKLLVKNSLTHPGRARSATRQSRSAKSDPSQQQEDQLGKQHRRCQWHALKKSKMGDWLLGKSHLDDGNLLRQNFEQRWIEFASETAALQAFDVLSHLLDTAPGQGVADSTFFSLL